MPPARTHRGAAPAIPPATDPLAILTQWVNEEPQAGVAFAHGAVLGTTGADGQLYRPGRLLTFGSIWAAFNEADQIGVGRCATVTRRSPWLAGMAADDPAPTSAPLNSSP